MPHEGTDYCSSQAASKQTGQPVRRKTCANKIDCGVPGRQGSLSSGLHVDHASDESYGSGEARSLPGMEDPVEKNMDTAYSPKSLTADNTSRYQARLLTYNTELDEGHVSEQPGISERSSVQANIYHPDKPDKSVAVSVSVELRSDRNHYLVVSIGPQVLASFNLRALKISRCWGAKCSTDRIVALTVPDCELDCGEIDVVYFKLDCYQSLERLSRMTGFDLD